MTSDFVETSSAPRPGIRDLLERMTLREKIGQMTQVEKNSIRPGDIREHCIGSILSGGGGNPEPNTPRAWRAMVSGFIDEALEHRLGIPLLYGVDAVHGHNNVVGATIFPHNIGLGATRDRDLLRRVGRATALEVAATSVRWDFAPAVSIPHDIRWGRTFEGYGQETEVVSELAVAFIEGLHGAGLGEPTSVLPSVKHYLADGATVWGSSRRIDRNAGVEADDRTLANANVDRHFARLLEAGAWQLDQGSSEIDEQTLRRVHLPPYRAAIDSGALNVMASYSSWGGLKMHEHRYLLTDILKRELGFEGFIVTDWEAIDQIGSDFHTCVVRSINAGIDMVMVPFGYERFIETLERAVRQGDVPVSRIDDAVTRILYVKERLGLFEHPHTDPALLERVGSPEHRALAREAVRKSAVLLKNDAVLPLPKEIGSLLVAGSGADDIGLQCGGWTISWMGGRGPTTVGTTILEGIRAVAARNTVVHYNADGYLGGRADAGVVVLSEEPYAEGMGDRADLRLTAEDRELLARVRRQCDRLVVILLSGRPLIVTDELDQWDAFVAAWLPGTEADGIADLLFGRYPFTGKLSFAWPRSMDQVPLAAMGEAEPLFPLGFGLAT
jgi:beta-glucosidase